MIVRRQGTRSKRKLGVYQTHHAQLILADFHTPVLSKAIDDQDSVLAPLRALRQVKHDRLKKELFELDKDAKLRSGARGWGARTTLIAFEKKVADSAEQ